MDRREFLRRAGREAAQTGAKIVPGAGLAKAALGGEGKPSLMQRLVGWRTGRTPEAAPAEPADTPDKSSSSDTPEKPTPDA